MMALVIGNDAYRQVTPPRNAVSDSKAIADVLRDQKARFALAMIDACRNNPFTSGGRALFELDAQGRSLAVHRTRT